jgi:CBS domain-containing protein
MITTSTVAEILKVKGNTTWSVTPKHTIYDTLKLMAEKNLGAVLVVDNQKIAGIFSERDFVRHFVTTSLRTKETPITEVMTKRVLFVNPTQTAEECMSIMTSKHIRHLPVLENDKLVGLISIGDVVKKLIEDQKFSLTQLERYVTGELG